MSKLVYLAAPYSDPDYDVRMLRYYAATYIASELMRRGELIYSPITHGHAIATDARKIACRPMLPTGWGFWGPHCCAMLRACEVMLVLTLPGYEQSEGIENELSFARDHGIPSMELSPWDFIDRTAYLKDIVKPIDKAGAE